MKAITKHISLTLGLVLAAACTSVDYPDRFVQTDGLPKVEFIRYADKDVIITQANMEEVVCLVGENLTSIHDLYFNDQAAVLNTSYMTANTLVVSVPKNMPEEETDKIYMYTKKGDVVTYDFKVLPPAPRVTSMSLEWAQPGETVTIYGSYLFAPLTVEFPGTDPVEVASSAGSSVDVKIPEGAQPGKIKVTTASGTAQSVFMYKDSRGMLFDFDGLTGLDNHGWNGHSSQDADDTSISGRYFQFGNGTAVLNDDTWDESNFSFVYWPGGSWGDVEDYADAPRLTDFADFSDWKNMALKFEMYIPASNPWTGCAMQICMAGVDKVTGAAGDIPDIDGTIVAGANNVYMTSNDTPRALYRPWTATGSFDTGDKWITVTIPFTEFTYGWDGNPASTELSADSFTSLWMFVCQGGVEGTEGTPVIKSDNIRAVPYK